MFYGGSLPGRVKGVRYANYSSRDARKKTKGTLAYKGVTRLFVCCLHESGRQPKKQKLQREKTRDEKRTCHWATWRAHKTHQRKHISKMCTGRSIATVWYYFTYLSVNNNTIYQLLQPCIEQKIKLASSLGKLAHEFYFSKLFTCWNLGNIWRGW